MTKQLFKLGIDGDPNQYLDTFTNERLYSVRLQELKKTSEIKHHGVLGASEKKHLRSITLRSIEFGANRFYILYKHDPNTKYNMDLKMVNSYKLEERNHAAHYHFDDFKAMYPEITFNEYSILRNALKATGTIIDEDPKLAKKLIPVKLLESKKNIQMNEFNEQHITDLIVNGEHRDKIIKDWFPNYYTDNRKSERILLRLRKKAEKVPNKIHSSFKSLSNPKNFEELKNDFKHLKVEDVRKKHFKSNSDFFNFRTLHFRDTGLPLHISNEKGIREKEKYNFYNPEKEYQDKIKEIWVQKTKEKTEFINEISEPEIIKGGESIEYNDTKRIVLAVPKKQTRILFNGITIENPDFSDELVNFLKKLQ